MILTPTGYRDIADCTVGDEVTAFDMVTGAPIVNTIENMEWVDVAEWSRWWQVEPAVPPFQFFRINGEWTLNSEQSIWRNGSDVCHVKNLIVGDIIYDDANQDVTVASIEEVAADGWWRFDISGDHSYIVDGLTLHNASRFWVGGTGTWDSSTTTHWAASTGGAGGQTVPGSSDTVTFDANSGGGTVTLNFGGTITVQSITLGAFASGTFDNSANNNNITLSANTGFSGSGNSTRTVKLGTATYTLSAASAQWQFINASNLTYTGNTGCNIVFSGGATGTRIFEGNTISHGNVTLGASSGSGIYNVRGSPTLASLSITAPNCVTFVNGSTYTISSAFTWSGSSSSHIGVLSDLPGFSTAIAAAGSSTAQWCAFRDVAFTGSPTATNSFDLLNNSGITITGPSGGGGGGGGGVIGS